MNARAEDPAAPPPIGGMRVAALAGAGAISLALTLDPYLLARVPAARMHEGVPLLMLGVSGAFIFGLGFRPSHRVARLSLHPAAILAVLLAGAWLLACG